MLFSVTFSERMGDRYPMRLSRTTILHAARSLSKYCGVNRNRKSTPQGSATIGGEREPSDALFKTVLYAARTDERKHSADNTEKIYIILLTLPDSDCPATGKISLLRGSKEDIRYLAGVSSRPIASCPAISWTGAGPRLFVGTSSLHSARPLAEPCAGRAFRLLGAPCARRTGHRERRS